MNKKTKIAQVIIHLGNGGTESLLREYVTNMDKDSFENVVFCIQRSQNSAAEKSLADAGIHVYFIGDMLKNGDSFINKLSGFIKSYYSVYSLLKKENPDVIHTHLSTNRFIMPYAITHRHTSYVHTVHCPVDFMFEGDIKKKAENLFVKYLTKFRKMQLIGLHADMAKELNERFHVDNSLYLENGIHLDKFRNPGVTKQEIRQELGISDDTFVLGHVGRMCPEKNHELIVKVFAKLHEKQPNSKLLLVGNGRCDAEVREMIDKAGISEDTIILSNRTDVNRILKAMDVFIFPSLFEGFGISLIEAESAGLKCVMADTIPTATYLSENIIVRRLSDSTDKWVDSILNEIPSNPVLDDIEKYNIKTVINKLQNIYTTTGV